MVGGLRAGAFVRYLPSVVGLPVGGMLGVAVVLVVPFGGSAELVVVAMFGGGAIGAMAGYAAGTRWYTARWVAAGEQLGLTPDDRTDGSRWSVPDLTGTVRGREVVVSYRSADSVDRTHIETRVDPPAEHGLIVHRIGDESASTVDVKYGSGDTGMFERIEGSDAGAVVQSEPFVAVGPSETTARAVVTGRSREALANAPELGEVRVGDPSSVYEAAVPDDAAGHAEMGAGIVFDALVSGDPAWATNRGDSTLLEDSDAIERHVEAIVSVAEAFEEARAETPVG